LLKKYCSDEKFVSTHVNMLSVRYIVGRNHQKHFQQLTESDILSFHQTKVYVWSSQWEITFAYLWHSKELFHKCSL